MQWIQAYWDAFWSVWLEAAPWLLLGLVTAGLIHVFVPTKRMAQWLGGRGLWPSLKAALIGTPLPLCSCSVLPAAMAVRKQGASKPSTVSFLVATPENGADSILLSWALLGPWYAIVRPVAAIASAVTAGVLATVLDKEDADDSVDKSADASQAKGNAGASCCSSKTDAQKMEPSSTCCGGDKVEAPSSCCSSGDPAAAKPTNAPAFKPMPFSALGLKAPAALPSAPKDAETAKPDASAVAPSCCSSAKAKPKTDAGCCQSQTDKSEAHATEHETGSCCDSNSSSALPAAGVSRFAAQIGQAIKYGFGQMLEDLAKWLMIGLLLAALLNTLIDPDTLTRWGTGPVAYLVMLVIGVPMYICATASTPVAASLLIAGVSPGAVLIFLLVGPATNLASIAVVKKALGMRCVVAYLIGVTVVALVAAFLIDGMGWLQHAGEHAEHMHDHSGWFSVVCGLVLAVLMAKALWVLTQGWLGKQGKACCHSESQDAESRSAEHNHAPKPTAAKPQAAGCGCGCSH